MRSGLLTERLSEILSCDPDTVLYTPVSGGDSNDTYRLEIGDGTEYPARYFLKLHQRSGHESFSAEEEGLKALARVPNGAAVPTPVARGRAGSVSYLLLEYIETGRGDSSSHLQLGRKLAAVHCFHETDRYGLAHDNYIGMGVQRNGWCDSWIEFFRVYRLEPQIKQAADSGLLPGRMRKRLSLICDTLTRYLREPAHPVPVHGDLWSGNYLFNKAGEPYLIDPAFYYGDPEVDLAMTELFGGFPPAFYRGYAEAAGIAPEYHERKDLYNLYHLLNHLNLFGTAYLRPVKSILEQYS